MLNAGRTEREDRPMAQGRVVDVGHLSDLDAKLVKGRQGNSPGSQAIKVANPLDQIRSP